jgi:hypothetical protein
MTFFTGYSGEVWSACYLGMAYYIDQLGTALTPEAVTSISESMLDSLTNGVNAIDAYDLAQGWNAEQISLTALTVEPIPLPPADVTLIENRLTAYQSGYFALSKIVPQPPFGAAGVISSGQSIIPDPNLLGFYSTFNFEPAPSGLTAANFNANAQAVAQAFSTAASGVQIFQGVNLTPIYDTANLESLSCSAIAALVSSFTSGPYFEDVGATNAWNQLVALPAMANVAHLITSAPFSESAQQSGVIRYAMIGMMNQISRFLLILRQPQTSQVNLTTLRNGETLMDVAARALGNFEEWTEIANLNGLFPPYVGPVAMPGIAAYGSQLLLPTPGTGIAATGASPSYEANFLGTDLYVGPINGVMPPWTGDFQIITGYKNLAWALGRRMQTTIGTLIYHSDYGSRIPPEVGQVQWQNTVGNIVAYGKSCLLSDPRVSSIVSASASGVSNTVRFSGTVQPKGFGASPVPVNEVISNLP